MCPGCGEQLGVAFVAVCAGKCAKMAKRQPKRDIVDTTFHASCVDGQISAKGSALPTS